MRFDIVGDLVASQRPQLRTTVHRWASVGGLLLWMLSTNGALAQDAAIRGDAPTVLTINEAERIALNRNPEEHVALSKRTLAFAQLSEEKAKLLPTAHLFENYSYTNNPVFVFSALLMQHKFRQQDFDLNRLNKPHPINNFFTAAYVHVPIFTQLQTITGIAEKRFASTRANREVDLVSQKIRLDLIKAFFGVVVAQANKDVADTAVKSASADVKQAKDMRAVGATVLSDQLAMEVQLSEFEQQQIQADGNLSIASAELNKVLGATAPPLQVVQGQLTDCEFVPLAQNEAVQQALASRPDLVQSQLQVRESREGVRAAHGRYLPKFDAYGGVIQDGNALVNGGTSLGLAVNMSFDLFDLKKPEQVKQAKAQQEIAQANLQQKSNEIVLEVIRAYKNFEVARRKRQVASTAVKQAQETLRIIRDRYRVGLTPITELLRAETAFVRAQSNLIGARYDCYIGYAEILKVTGRLDSVAQFAG